MKRRTFHAALGALIGGPLTAPAPGQSNPKKPTLVERLEFFDGDVIFGPPFASAQDVVQELDHYRIKEGLLFHQVCRDKADARGNLDLAREIQNSASSRKRLHLAWCIVPQADGRLPSAPEVLAGMREHGARAARVFPRNHGYRLEGLKEILGALEERKVPLLVDYGITFPHNDRTDWEEVEWALRSYPGLHIILCHPPSRKNIQIFRMMELSRQFHLSPAGFRIHQEVHAMTRLFGPQAVVFGSHSPFVTAAAPIAEVIYSGLDAREQKQIAGDTLRDLLREARL